MFFRRKPAQKPVLRPLFMGVEPLTGPSKLEAIAGANVGIGTGLKMIATQASNEVLRHCRIGTVTPKLKANA